jgi:hypothetical protein
MELKAKDEEVGEAYESSDRRRREVREVHLSLVSSNRRSPELVQIGRVKGVIVGNNFPGSFLRGVMIT